MDQSLLLSIPEICLRLLCAVLVGTVIGLERESTHRPAGLRTHMIVALGASSVMITSQLLFYQYAPFTDPDPARLPAQVIAGVGFLGAGTILREGVNVKGLTTAASLWTVACLGLAAGAGYYAEALIGTAMMLVILTIIERLQGLLFRQSQKLCYITVLTTDAAFAMETIHTLLDQQNAMIIQVQMDQGQDELYTIRMEVQFSRRRQDKHIQSFITALAANKEIKSVKTSFDPIS